MRPLRLRGREPTSESRPVLRIEVDADRLVEVDETRFSEDFSAEIPSPELVRDDGENSGPVLFDWRSTTATGESRARVDFWLLGLPFVMPLR